MYLTQLNPPIPVITPKGEGYAHLIIDYGPEFSLLWVCFQDDTGECWTWPNHEIRGPKNTTMGRHTLSPFRKAPADAGIAAKNGGNGAASATPRDAPAAEPGR
jgi:hypothetical protein